MATSPPVPSPDAAPINAVSRPFRGSEPPVFPGGRDRSIPISALDLDRVLQQQTDLPPAEQKALAQLQKLLAAVFHNEFRSWLNELKDRYAPIDPDAYQQGRRFRRGTLDEGDDEEFLEAFEGALIRANYQRLEFSHLEAAVAAPNGMGMDYAPNFEMFEHLRVYVRGRCSISRKFRDARRLFRHGERVFEAYRRVVVVLKFVKGAPLDDYMRDDVVYLRMYRDVPFAEMDMHLPEQGTKIRMRWLDRVQIASPLVTGLPTLAMKLFGTVMVGLSPFVIVSLLAIPVGAGLKSFFGFRQAKSKYFHTMIRHLYYLTQANNASVLSRLIDSAEEEEYKEAMVAYYILRRHNAREREPWDQPRLDREIERFFRETVTLDTDFEIGDALDKLLRLGLVHRDGDGTLSALPPDRALRVLDAHWDDLFRFAYYDPTASY